MARGFLQVGGSLPLVPLVLLPAVPPRPLRCGGARPLSRPNML